MKPAEEETQPLDAGPSTYGSIIEGDIEALKSHVKLQRGSTRSLTDQYKGICPSVLTVDEIPEVVRGKYVKDGKVIVPVVGVAVKVISVSKLNMAENTFLADFNVNVAWIGGPMDGPEVSFYNIVEEIEREQVPTPPEERTKEDKNTIEDVDGVVHWEMGKPGSFDGVTEWDHYYRIRIRGTFRQQYKLAMFPFDKQNLTVLLHMKTRCKLIPLRWGLTGDSCSCDPRAVNEEFALVGASVNYKYLPSYKFGRVDGYDPEAAIVFSIVRKPTFWVVSYGLVASMVCTLMACTYAIPARAVGERLAVATMLVLTMTATKYLMMEKLPSVSYFTLLDIHIVFCMMVVTVLTCQIGLTGLLGWREIEHLEYIWLPWVGVLWFCYHAGVLAWIAGNTMGN